MNYLKSYMQLDFRIFMEKWIILLSSFQDLSDFFG